MSESTESKPLAFLRIASKTTVNGRFTEASVSLPIDAPVLDGDFWTGVDGAFNSAKAAVLDALGVEYDFDAETGKLVEKVVVQTASAPAGAVSAGDVPSCPKCGSDMYDNRLTKKNPRQPDFKCKAYKDGCDGAVWPPR